MWAQLQIQRPNLLAGSSSERGARSHSVVIRGGDCDSVCFCALAASHRVIWRVHLVTSLCSHSDYACENVRACVCLSLWLMPFQQACLRRNARVEIGRRSLLTAPDTFGTTLMPEWKGICNIKRRAVVIRAVKLVY
jgi:hypothetical protein